MNYSTAELQWYVDHYLNSVPPQWHASDEALAAECGSDETAYVENRMLGMADVLGNGDPDLAFKVARFLLNQ